MGSDSSPGAVNVEETSTTAESSNKPESLSSINSLKPKMEIQGTVSRVELQGAIVDIGSNMTGLLHISQLSSKSVKNVTDIVKEGDSITAYILAVDTNKNRVDLTLIKPPAVTWDELEVNAVYSGKVVRLEKFGAFLDIGAERPGLIHVSELANSYVTDPAEVVKVGDTVEARLIGVNKRKKQIDLSVKSLQNAAAIQAFVEDDEEEEELPTAMELALRRAMDSGKSAKQQGKRKKKQREASQVDIFERTLKLHDGN